MVGGEFSTRRREDNDLTLIKNLQRRSVPRRSRNAVWARMFFSAFYSTNKFPKWKFK